MTLTEQIITIGICIVAVQFTRLLPFFVFPVNRPIPQYIRYLGKVLPLQCLVCLSFIAIKILRF